jgi:hypothetical protein
VGDSGREGRRPHEIGGFAVVDLTLVNGSSRVYISETK